MLLISTVFLFHLFIVLHSPEPCLAIAFPYLSYCQQMLWCLCCWKMGSSRVSLLCCYLRRAVWYSVCRGTKCQDGGPGNVVGRCFLTFDLVLIPCEGVQINLCFWYKNNSCIHIYICIHIYVYISIFTYMPYNFKKNL